MYDYELHFYKNLDTFMNFNGNIFELRNNIIYRYLSYFNYILEQVFQQIYNSEPNWGEI